MPDVVTAIGTAITLTRQLLDLANASKDAKSKLLIADLTIQLADVKMRLAELIEENAILKSELKRESSSRSEITLKDGLYFTESGDGPFCTGCYDDRKKLIRLTEMGRKFRDLGHYTCPSCKSTMGK